MLVFYSDVGSHIWAFDWYRKATSDLPHLGQE